ncbi:MAG: AAA family ATPase [Lachnospiraceae bacterium]|nr:AAA family ATPase [Lachnospiraceae bacterium]
MGMYLNPGFENFREILSARIYVDKTMMIAEINRMIDEGHKYICMSRPRRVGKTITSNMLCAYYSKGCDSRELFKDLKIAGHPSFEEKRNKYNVIKLDWNYEYQKARNKEKVFDRMTDRVIEDMKEEYPDIRFTEDDALADAIERIYSKTGETFVILMDEYDVFVREKVDEGLFNKYLALLNSLFKSDTLRPAISLAYLTGIMPIVRDRVQSKLNNFSEYTILDSGELAEYVGFTADEVKELCRQYDMDYAECRSWYDGYSQRGYEIYNPESVVKCMLNREYEPYWNKTSTYMVIVDRIKENFRGTREAVIRMLSGESVDVDVDGYMNTMDSFGSKDDILAYLIHLGYLAYDHREKTCRIPNREIRNEWYNAIEDAPDYKVTERIIKDSKELLKQTAAGDAEAVAKALDESHIHVTSNRSYNNEDALGSAIYLSYIYALNSYTCVRKMTAGKGFADVVYIPVHPGDPEKPAMIMELKRNDRVESAVDQIKERKYFDSLDHYQGRLLFVGIEYDEKEKTHTARIEWFEK